MKKFLIIGTLWSASAFAAGDAVPLDGEQKKALLGAIKLSHVEVIKTFLEAGVGPDAYLTEKNETLLKDAARRQFALSEGVLPVARARGEERVACWEQKERALFEICKLLVEYGANTNGICMSEELKKFCDEHTSSKTMRQKRPTVLNVVSGVTLVSSGAQPPAAVMVIEGNAVFGGETPSVAAAAPPRARCHATTTTTTTVSGATVQSVPGLPIAAAVVHIHGNMQFGGSSPKL